MDVKNFERWAMSFMSDCESLMNGGRTSFLVFDGCSSPMSMKVLEILKAGNRIALELPRNCLVTRAEKLNP